MATHHLTALFLTAFVTAALIALLITRAPRQQLIAASAAAAIAIVISSAWILLHSPSTVQYLANFPQQGIKQIIALIEHRDSSGGARSAFGATALPKYEPLLAYAQPVIVLGLWIVGALVMWRRRDRAYMWWLIVITGAYFLTLPLILTALGSAPAHRSWPFLWQAGSILMAIAFVAIIAWAARHHIGRTIAWIVTTVLLAVLFIGSGASDFNAEARFPGKFESGIDGRQVDSESYATAAWLRAHVKPGVRFVAGDQYTAGVISGLTRLTYDDHFPTWDVIFYAPPLTDKALDSLEFSPNKYLIVDTRMLQTPFRGGYYLSSNEPDAFTRTKPLPASALEKLNHEISLKHVFSTEHIRVYEITRDDEHGEDEAHEVAGG